MNTVDKVITNCRRNWPNAYEGQGLWIVNKKVNKCEMPKEPYCNKNVKCLLSYISNFYIAVAKIALKSHLPQIEL